MDAVETYERDFVPALFAHWADRVVARAGIQAGMSLVDIACGTGIVARRAAAQLGPGASVVGIDGEPAMVEHARKIAPAIDWRVGDAHELPFAAASFDRVTCGFGLMFFGDRVRALAEMRRVARPGGVVSVSVWDDLERNICFATLAELLDREVGVAAGDLLRSPFSLGSTVELDRLFQAAGFQAVQLATEAGVARFPSIRHWVETEIHGWVGLCVDVEATATERIVAAAERELASFVEDGGSFEVPVRAHLVTAFLS